MKNKIFYPTWVILINIFFIVIIFPLFIFSTLIIFILNFKYNKGPLFFIQKRLGLNGKTFNLYKFRTMYIDAELDGPQWSSENDPRITTLGKFLRKSRIDELPQVLNIILFQMNLIGPRAERPEMRDQIIKKIYNFNDRLSIKPGLTGLAQVTSGYLNTIENMHLKLNDDLYYINNRSIFLDIKILLNTFYSIIKLLGI